MIFVGVDPSIRCSAVVALGPGGELVQEFTIIDRRIPRKPAPEARRKKSSIRRLEPAALRRMCEGILERLALCLEGDAAAHVVVEEPFVGNNAAAALKTYGVFAVVCFEMERARERGAIAKLYPLPPMALKQFVGAKEKNFVAREVFRRWGYAANDDNLVDAYGLARWALERFTS